LEQYINKSSLKHSERTKELLETRGNFILDPRGEMEIKGKGKMKTYWLIRDYN